MAGVDLLDARQVSRPGCGPGPAARARPPAAAPGGRGQQRRRCGVPICGGRGRVRVGAQGGERRGARSRALTEDDLHAVGRVHDPVGSARGEVEDQAGHLGVGRAELGEPHLAHRGLVDFQVAHRRAARDVLEVHHQAVGVAEEEVLVAQASVGADGDGQLAAFLGLHDRKDARGGTPRGRPEPGPPRAPPRPASRARAPGPAPPRPEPAAAASTTGASCRASATGAGRRRRRCSGGRSRRARRPGSGRAPWRRSGRARGWPASPRSGRGSCRRRGPCW